MPVYTALYRQWRPRRFASMVGQEHVTRTLRNALRAGSAAHAYLFCGPRGTGKTSAARILAAALNCEHPEDGDACAACETCRQVAEDRLLDVQEIDAASNRQVEDVRALRETVGYAPSAGRHKVYILDEVHMLTEASWNTLLKTLEEPPPATTFILCTTDPQHVLGTVVSRCQRFDFRRLSGEEIEGQLARVCDAEGLTTLPSALRAISRRADGGLRDALAILEQAAAFAAAEPLSPAHVASVLGAADDDTAQALLRAAETGDAAELFARVSQLHAEGRDMAQVCRDLLGTLRDGIVDLLATPGGSAGDAGVLPWRLHAMELLAQAEGQMRRSAQPRLVLEVALMRTLIPPSEAPAAAAVAATRTPTAPRRPASQDPAEMPEPARDPDARRAGSAPDRDSGGDAGGSAATASFSPPHGFRGSQPPWEQFLEQVRQVNRPAHAVLLNAEPLGVTDGELRLAFPSKIFADKAAERVQVMERAWVSAGGEPVHVVCVVAASAAAAAGSRDGRRAPSRGAAPTATPVDQAPPPVGPPTPVQPGPTPVTAGGAGLADPATAAAYRRALSRFDGRVLSAERRDTPGV